MDVKVEALNEEPLAQWLIGADPSERADAWCRLVQTLGRAEASRRWLAGFAAFDAAET